MDFWINFWTVFFYASLLVFAGLAVVVTIFGFFDIRSLFKKLSEDNDRQNENSDPEPSPKPGG